MGRSRYPYLVQQRQRWFVRMVVPPDVRDIIGRRVFKVPTGHTDPHRAATAAAPVIADLQQRIRDARDTGKQSDEITAERLAERYRSERELDAGKAEMTRITDIVAYVLKKHGHSWADHAMLMRRAGYDLHTALRLLPDGDAAARTADQIAGHATPFLAYLERWKPDAGLKPRPLDQAISSLRQFDRAVGKCIEQISGRDVQRWIDGLIKPDAPHGAASKTVKRKMGKIRNYWRWLQAHSIVSDDKTRSPAIG